MENFNEKALNWDNEPRRLERARGIADNIRNALPCLQHMNGLEYGCGTGLLSFELQKDFSEITLADNSEGMLDVVKQKIAVSNIRNMTPKLLDLTRSSMDEKFDVIYTLMTLHHILDIGKIISKFRKLLNPSGYLCIADLAEEDGSFHGKDFIGHKGFKREYLMGILNRFGFKELCWKICYNNLKRFEDGTEKSYPIFLLIVQKE